MFCPLISVMKFVGDFKSSIGKGGVASTFAEFFDCILTHVNTGIRVALSFLFGILGRVFPALFLHFLLKGVSLAFLVVSLANVSAF